MWLLTNAVAPNSFEEDLYVMWRIREAEGLRLAAIHESMMTLNLDSVVFEPKEAHSFAAADVEAIVSGLPEDFGVSCADDNGPNAYVCLDDGTAHELASRVPDCDHRIECHLYRDNSAFIQVSGKNYDFQTGVYVPLIPDTRAPITLQFA